MVKRIGYPGERFLLGFALRSSSTFGHPIWKGRIASTIGKLLYMDKQTSPKCRLVFDRVCISFHKAISLIKKVWIDIGSWGTMCPIRKEMDSHFHVLIARPRVIKRNSIQWKSLLLWRPRLLHNLEYRLNASENSKATSTQVLRPRPIRSQQILNLLWFRLSFTPALTRAWSDSYWWCMPDWSRAEQASKRQVKKER